MDRDDKFWHDLNEREEAWAYEKAEFDKMAHYVDGEAKGRAEGRIEGRAEGRIEGRAEGKVDVEQHFIRQYICQINFIGFCYLSYNIHFIC